MELPLTALLAPFLAIIRSSLSTGPITSVALMSLHTFFVSGLIQPGSVAAGPALASLSNTVANCKFEASDSAGDEVVLLRILAVIKECMCGSVGYLLGDVEVCEMLETVLTICCQMRTSGSVDPFLNRSLFLTHRMTEILRRSAELQMHALVRQVFSRLKNLDPQGEESKMRPPEGEMSKGDVKMSVQAVRSNSEALLAKHVTPEATTHPGDGMPEAQGTITSVQECMYRFILNIRSESSGTQPYHLTVCRLSRNFYVF